MVIRAGAVLACFGLGAALGWAQTDATSADTREKAAEEARQEAIIDRYLTAVPSELVGKVDSQNAKVGQEVSVRTMQDARLANETELPKGTILHGRVTQVHAQGQQSAGAMMALTFDQAEVKGGKMIPVHCVIEAVNPIKGIPGADRMAMGNRPVGMGGGGMTGSQPVGVPSIGTDAGSMGSGVGRVGIQQRTGVAPMGSGIPGAGGPMDTGGIGGVGGVGGAAGGGSMGTGVGAGTDSTIGGVGGVGAGTTGTAGTTVPVDGLPGSVVGSGPVSPSAYGVAPVRQAGEDISAIVVPTGFPGLLLSNKRTGGASGVLMETGHNITLDGGTRITMGVITR